MSAFQYPMPVGAEIDLRHTSTSSNDRRSATDDARLLLLLLSEGANDTLDGARGVLFLAGDFVGASELPES